MKYGVMIYESTNNIGDDIQSYAAKRFLPRIDTVIDREEMDGFCLRNKVDEPVTVIMNGWYMHRKFNWPPSPLINPLWISTHISVGACLCIGDHFLDGLGGDYLRQFEPIGARDESTLALLKEKGIELSTAKIRKILITGGVYTTERSREVAELFERYKSVKLVAAELGLSTALISMYLPYGKTVYDLEEKSGNARRVARWREKKAVDGDHS